MTEADDETIIPMNEVTAKPKGMVSSCDHRASLGFRANLEKSGLFMIKAAKFPKQLINAFTTAQASVLP